MKQEIFSKIENLVYESPHYKSFFKDYQTNSHFDIQLQNTESDEFVFRLAVFDSTACTTGTFVYFVGHNIEKIETDGTKLKRLERILSLSRQIGGIVKKVTND